MKYMSLLAVAILICAGCGFGWPAQQAGATPNSPVCADALTRAGIAVLRVDDRGVGQSTGDSKDWTIFDKAAMRAPRSLGSVPAPGSIRAALPSLATAREDWSRRWSLQKIRE